MINYWKKLPHEVADSQSINAFKLWPVIFSPEWMSLAEENDARTLSVVPGTGWGAMAKKFHFTMRKNLTLRVTEHWNSCQGLWSLPLWELSKPTRTHSWVTCSGWRSLGRGCWTEWSPQVPSNPARPHTPPAAALWLPWSPILLDTSLSPVLESCLAQPAQELFGNKSGLYLTVALLATVCWLC